jgi:heparosan-N-sulfate-glucuronate 5-epimerase
MAAAVAVVTSSFGRWAVLLMSVQRWLRCTASRRLTACVCICLLVTAALWLRCDDVIRPSTDSLLTHAQFSSRNIVAVADGEYSPDDISNDAPVGDVDEDGTEHDVAWQSNHNKTPLRSVGLSVGFHPVECVINGDYSIHCQQDENGEVYLPFTFIRKYFEVYGKMADTKDQFHWQHSYSRVYAPEQKYSPDGVFMSFDHYHVEVRERVKCISAIEGVPVSTQWGPRGYFYPTQIAQYGLSHYSKYIKAGGKELVRNTEIIENGEQGNVDKWTANGVGNVQNVFDSEVQSHVIEFHSSDVHSARADVRLLLTDTEPGKFFLSLDVRFITNGSITVVVETSYRRTLRLHYVCSDNLLSTVGEDIIYGIGVNRTKWGWTFGRDLTIDVQKGILQKYLGRKKRPPRVVLRRVTTIELRGIGRIDNITLAQDAHLLQFFYAADWLERRQDDRGGWPIAVVRSLADGRLTLAPGWYSAMAQGHAMSVLVRAHARTGRAEYMNAAVRALSLFEVSASEGGIVARFMDRHVWYEEYPTSPPCFVLNGFMYALVGLYDVALTAPPGDGRDTAARLFTVGMQSLRALLPLFDTGSGSVYDLRHLTLGGTASPNRARWDYHATHINQILLLATLLRDGTVWSNETAAVELEAIAQRWMGYMRGKLAAHN